jgi:hypothetical protein
MIRSRCRTEAPATPHRGSERSRTGGGCFYFLLPRCLSGMAKRFHHCTQPTRAHGSLRSVHPAGTLVRGIVRIDTRGLPSAYPRGVYLGNFPRCDRGAVDQPPHLVRRGLSNQHLAPHHGFQIVIEKCCILLSHSIENKGLESFNAPDNGTVMLNSTLA